MPGKIELLLPGLFDLPLSELPPGLISGELPALNRILRLSSPRSNSAFSIDTMLRQALALESSSKHAQLSLPLAHIETMPPGERRSRARVSVRGVAKSASWMLAGDGTSKAIRLFAWPAMA